MAGLKRGSGLHGLLLAPMLLLSTVLWAAEPAPSPSRITYCIDPDWYPYENLSDGRHVGISADLLTLLAQRTGLEFTLVPTRDWDETLAASRDGRCDLLSFLNQTPKREEWLTFTEPLFTDPNVIITRADHGYVPDLGALDHPHVVLPRGTAIEEWLRRDYPNLTVTNTENEAEAFRLVSDGLADLTIRSMTVSGYTIRRDGWFNLRISGQVPGYDNKLRIGIRKEKAALRDILNAGIASITPLERAQIANRHVAIEIASAPDYRLIGWISALFSVGLLTSLFWIIKLNRLNRRLKFLSVTDRLTGLFNRGKLNDTLMQEIERHRRLKRPLSILLLDLDHFKAINDSFGHLAGDHVLQETAALLRALPRRYDTAGRWGGEEFLLICPETSAEAALGLAERITDSFRHHLFPGGRHHTVSIGVSTLAGDEGLDSLLNRADVALYQAKSSGRDRAVAA